MVQGPISANDADGQRSGHSLRLLFHWDFALQCNHTSYDTLTTDNPAPVLIKSNRDDGARGMDGELLLWVAAGYFGLLVIGAAWIALALSTHRSRHRRQLERYEQRLRNELEATYRQRAVRRFE
jgi:hypothetical protein